MTMAFVRELKLNLGAGIAAVPVSISSPARVGAAWFCHYEIAWPEGASAGDVGGADALQALYLSMQAVALVLYASPHHKAGRLSWQRAGGGYGFPIPKPGRSDLVGDDRDEQA
jgi:hypothetical protein